MEVGEPGGRRPVDRVVIAFFAPGRELLLGYSSVWYVEREYPFVSTGNRPYST